MMTAQSNHGAMSTTLPPTTRHSGARRASASLVRLVIQAILAGAAIVLVVQTGWPMRPETTLVLGMGFVLWLVASFAAEPAP
jgi:hypothetical protein